MAQTCSYSYMGHWPLAQGMQDDTVNCNSLFMLSIVGPASSVSAGQVVASISADITYIRALWFVEQGVADYIPQFIEGTGGLASDAVIKFYDTSTEATLSGDTDLSGQTFRVMGVGSGPFASAID